MLSQLNDLALKTCGDKTNRSQLLILPFINKYKEKLLQKNLENYSSLNTSLITNEHQL